MHRFTRTAWTCAVALWALGAQAEPPPGQTHPAQTHRSQQHPHSGPPPQRAPASGHPPRHGHMGAQHMPMPSDMTAHAGIGFTAGHWQAARDYFGQPEHQGFVPPGLRSKGGMPPGQARKWQRGRPLPAGVVYYELPRSLVLTLGVPPVGYRYVRVASDILLMAIASGIVVDAMEDLVR